MKKQPSRRALALAVFLLLLFFTLQEFPGAERIVSDVQSGEVTVWELQQRRIVQDDRIEFTMTDSALLFGSPDRGTAY